MLAYGQYILVGETAMSEFAFPSTGLPSLDEVITHLRMGDNVVWQVDDIEDYRHFVTPYVKTAVMQKRAVVYMRFATHPPLVEPGPGVQIFELDAAGGFESFSTQVHKIITEQGVGAFYVFDCLSDLLSAWATDLMIGNFFMITCPYLFELDTIAYFAILRENHSFKTVARIRETTQLLLDLYSLSKTYYVHPLKVWNRYSPTMFLPHRVARDKLVPITSSADASRLFSYISDKARQRARRHLDYWDLLFLRAEEILSEETSEARQKQIVEQICRIMIAREPRLLGLAEAHFNLRDLLNVKARLIGTGYVGGKAVGMLLARKILSEDTLFDWSSQMEAHDSFYIGSDVFYAYIVQNGSWRLRMEQRTPSGYFAKAPELKQRLLKGRFPDEIRDQFQEMLEFFGQSPIIVRSSSLLEDSFGNAFAGKYESLFLVNQGSPEHRYREFENAVRTIYASTMDEDALMYRLQRGLSDRDEQMALLVQRVSGSYRGHYFFPDIGGVGVSYNTFVWNSDIDPKAGMLRMVLGLGTRAVDRVEHDYPRLVALDAPLSRPQAGMEDIRRFSQHDVDVLNIAENSIQTVPLSRLLEEGIGIDLSLMGVEDLETTARMRELGMKAGRAYILTFDKLLSETDLAQKMQRVLKTVQAAYDYPVDIEFTVNFPGGGQPQINLLQCRPLQTKGSQTKVQIPEDLTRDRILLASDGSFMGGNIAQRIDRLIYIDPKGYIALPLAQKYDIARLVGALNKAVTRQDTAVILMGPGRWGTTTPSLGVPVSFAEINNMAVLTELSYPGGNLMPELSYGTHFFQDLVETDIFYLALFTEKPGVVLNQKLLDEFPNLFLEMVPDGGRYANIVRVLDTRARHLQILADLISQRVVCFV
jgi:hypothetical protein